MIIRISPITIEEETNEILFNLSASELNLDWLRARRLIEEGGNEEELKRMDQAQMAYIDPEN